MQLSKDEISLLSVDEPLDLIGQLWDSLEPGEIGLTTAQKAELDRRLEAFDEDRVDGVSWEVLRAELARRCP